LTTAFADEPKKKSYMIGMSIMSVGVMAFSLLGPILGPTFGVILMAFCGIGLSTHYVMPHAILPDIVEWDAHTKGKGRREGVYSSLWTFTSKLGQALALALNGWILALVGYNSTAITSLSRTGIILLCGPLPLLWYLVGLSVIKHYPIDRAFYEAMISEA